MRTTIAIVWAATVLSTASDSARACIGDCNGDGTVAITELILMVNLAMEGAPSSSCLSGADDSEPVRIHALVGAVRHALDGCPQPTPTPTPCPDDIPLCGNGVVEVGEECDVGGICVGGSSDLEYCTSPVDCPDGRCTTVGGQPTEGGNCAANCTLETARTMALGRDSRTVVQLASSTLSYQFRGHQTIRSGFPRLDDTIDVNCESTFRAGDIPLVAKAADVQIDPIPWLGLYCLCVTGLETPSFGAGNSATGRISCGGPLEGVDYILTQDFNSLETARRFATPGCSHARDPECDDVSEIAPGVFSTACRDNTSPGCEIGGPPLPTGCRSPLEIRYAGMGVSGSAVIQTRSVTRWLRDFGCNSSLAGMDPCPFSSYGPDCIPCTDDDVPEFQTEHGPWTTGTARGALYNALDNTTHRNIDEGSGAPCTENADCPSARCARREVCLPINGQSPECTLPCGDRPCRTVQTGEAINCDQFTSNQSSQGFGGGVFASCAPSIARFGGSVICSRYTFD